jgi:hypothetical protein
VLACQVRRIVGPEEWEGAVWLATGLAERQVAELVDDDGESVTRFASTASSRALTSAARSSAPQLERSPLRSATGSSAMRAARNSLLNEAAHAATPESCGIRPPAGWRSAFNIVFAGTPRSNR